MEYAALDLETTGLDAARDRVIEVGAVAFELEAVGSTLERLADPGRAVPEVVLQLTGITQAELAGAIQPEAALAELADFIRDRQAVGHGAVLDVDFLRSAGLWEEDREIIDTLHLARILLPNAPSHSLPLLAQDLGLEHPRPHRALDDADATRQLFLRLRQEAAGLDDDLKESMVALVAPYGWAIARFFAEALASAASGMLISTPVLEPQIGVVPKPAGPPPSDDPAHLAAMLEPAGLLATSLPQYEPREPQRQMLLAVAQTMQRGGTLVVEAGTGTGKSLAYLIPAVARAVKRGERIVISTNTHTLQEQLMQKDLPALQQWLPWSFRACLLKGRQNYVSLRRWRRFLGQPCADPEELRFKLKIMVWLHQTQIGDRSELRLHGREEVLWAQIASDPLDCVGVFCRAEDCFVHRARAEAEKADLVVVNHALLLADIQTGGGILPAYDHLVVDEAHHLEDAATQGLAQEVDGPGLRALLERLADGDGGGLIAEIAERPRLGAEAADLELAAPLALNARSRTRDLFAAAAEWVSDRRLAVSADLPEEDLVDPGARLREPALRRDETLRLVADLRLTAGWQEVINFAADAVTALAALDAGVRRIVTAGREWLGGDEPDQSLRELEIIRGRLAEAATLLREAIVEPDPNRVYWFTLVARTTSLSLRSVPLNVGDLLSEHVYQARRSVILTSASLAVGGSFEYFCSRAGISPGAETVILESPFDYLNQALVCLPTDLPDPRHPDFGAVLSEVIADVAGRIGGRTLVLFTSHRQLRDTYFSLRSRSDLDHILILGQGIDGQRRQVLKSFLEADRPLLLGTSSFWEGIDIPGDRLSCVILVKLPFPVPTDPVFAARSEQVRDPFTGFALPLAALRLKQGFGRLIRRRSDRGAVVLLDGRVLSREYGRAFLEVLPPASRYLGPVEEVGARVQEWIETGATRS